MRHRFKIIKPLGRGGFGKTYLAEDTDKLKEPCVVKQLVYQAQGSHTNKLIVDLFMREAQQLQQFWANPQVPSLFAYFEEGGYLYLVQQYVEGQDLLQELEAQGCFSDQKIQALLADLLPVFAAIHHHQVLHRDIKPENIMRRHSDGRLILIDFGVSKQLSKSLVSVAGTLVGSLGYAAPEQMESGIAQPASDLYSLGASCFHLLTDINPWSLWKRQGYGWLGQWRQQVQQPLSPELELVLDKLLQLEPADRYQSASAVLADLHPPPKPLTTTPLTPQPPAQSLPTPTPQEIPFHPPLFGSQSVGSPPAKSSPTPNSKGRRQFLTLAAYGGVGLGSVLLWKAVDSSQKGAENSDPPPELSLDSPTPSPEATPEPNSSPSPSPETSSSLQNFSFEVARVDAQGKITNRSQEQAQFFAEDLGSGITLDMVAIPAGQFTMGSPASEPERDSDESPQHQVSIPAFYLGKYEITQAQWQAIMGSNPSGFQGANRPVEQVSWNEAIAFCQKLSQKTGREYRLPSEAEWEYACRAGTSTPFHFGPTLTPAIANYDGTSTYGSGPKGQYRQQTIDVGSFPPNAFGLYDMHGNVWEWCQDTWHDNYTGAPTDGSAWVSENDNDPRILRGGSWLNDPRYCRCANRGRYDPGDRPTTLGFRVALSAPRTS